MRYLLRRRGHRSDYPLQYCPLVFTSGVAQVMAGVTVMKPWMKPVIRCVLNVLQQCKYL